ncbi:MAG: patatin family protein, partial [Firmicutes bacterium]|nr:patatin family protein [Bacillota bacterium]
MYRFGLVLEGGGMRGIYTSGVLDLFMKKKLEFPYINAVSAGVYNAMNYMSHQRGRSRKIYLNFANDERYISKKNLLLNGELFGFEFMFDELALELLPYDFEAFYSNPAELAMTTTDCTTGRPKYFYKNSLDAEGIKHASIASSSMPLMAKPVEIDGSLYMDGTEADPMPVRRAFEDGCEKLVVVLTRDRDYVKKSEFLMNLLARRKYGALMPELLRTIEKRPNVYN